MEDIEQQQSGGVAGGSGEESSEGFFNFKRVPFREKTAKSYGIKRTSYHLNLENPQSTFPVGQRNIIRAFEEGLANSIRELIDGLPDHDRILQHKCYLQPVTHEQKKNKQRTIFVYFDIEAQQDTGNHVANLVCAETDQNDTQFTFEGKDCVPDFIQWVHSLANQEDVEKVIVVAHNFKGYDGYFILDELYKQHATHLKQIVNSAKILSLELPNIKFIDSMNFFPMALSNFPKTFGLNEMKKGFFPHFFNTQQNQIYEGYMPEKSYYDPDGMSPQRKEEFDKWYNEKVSERYIFNFQHELMTYCQSDVRLLKQGCIKFQSQFHDICGFNPMVHCITISSACNTAYRKNWMPKNQIAIEPVRG